MSQSLHIIRKQSLDFHFNGRTDGFALQKEVSDWCNFTLIPEIERQLDVFNSGESYLQIDKLEIDAIVDSVNWKQKIRDELIFSLKQKIAAIKAVSPKTEEEKAVKKHRLDDLILFYFENGYLPWWGETLLEPDFKTVLQRWISEEIPAERAEMITGRLKHISSKNVVERLINQLPRKLYFQLLKNLYKDRSLFLNHLESFFETGFLNGISPEKRKAIAHDFYSHLFKITIKNKGEIDSDSILPFLYKELITNKISASKSPPLPATKNQSTNPVLQAWQLLLSSESKNTVSKNTIEVHSQKAQDLKKFEPDEITRDKQLHYNLLIDKLMNENAEHANKKASISELQEGIFIDNAGAVIIAAFIPALFKELELEKEGQIINPDQAAMIIQYCISGNEKIEEYELVLPKILCGLELEFPINTNSVISENQKHEANEMLQALIQYWEVLKNTSPEGLRESFLKRSGKLSFADGEWLLQVEQKSFDILLDRIPWSISMIRLPWMKHLLRTEWVQ